jgi:phenylacetate-coenzyme A ligase PaaK-like adenylate-forming protein
MGTSMTTDTHLVRQAALRAAVPGHIDRLTWSTDRLRLHQRDQLRTLLHTARERSRFHADRLRYIDPDRFETDDLVTLPTMNKTEMMASFDDLVTDPRVTRQLVEEHLARTGADASELLDEYLVLASGGSSGERGVFVYHRTAAIDFLLGLIRPGLARLVALVGELPADPACAAIVAAGSGVHATRALASLFGGDLVDTVSIPATDPIESIARRVEQAQPDLLQGYPSVIRRLADEKLAGRLVVTPMSVTTTSEPLDLETRARIDQAFGVGVCNMFGSSEGVLGVSPPDDPAIVLASDLAIVELVDEHNAPVEPGKPSSKVLVTNLSNRLQPLIRYELTDSFVEQPSDPSSGHLRVMVEGRRDDTLCYPNGAVIHPIAIRSVLVQTPAIVESQVRQTRGGIDVDVVAEVSIDAGRVESALGAALGRGGLPNPVVRLRVVDRSEIERHPDTGKTRRFIPLPG